MILMFTKHPLSLSGTFSRKQKIRIIQSLVSESKKEVDVFQLEWYKPGSEVGSVWDFLSCFLHL